MNSVNWKEILEDNNIRVGFIGDKAVDNRGNSYVTLTSGGVKEQGRQVGVLHSSQEAAVKAFEDELLYWLNGRRLVNLRMYPEVRSADFYQDTLHDSFDKVTYYYVACRLTAY